MNSPSNTNNRKGSTMKMRARRGDLITLTSDARGYFEQEQEDGVLLVRGDLALETVRVIKAHDKFHHDWPSDIPQTNLMRVRFEGQEYLVARQHRDLCLVAGS